MDRSPGRTFWSRLAEVFGNRNDSLENLEQAIIEARDDGELEAAEGSMILSILKLDDVQVQDIMTPRTDFHCIPLGMSIVEAAALTVECGHSRLPVFEDSRDNIIGIVHAKDMLKPLLGQDREATLINDLMRQPYFVPETKLVSELLQEFRTRKNHLAIVVDEYGGTSGLVTIEDVLEEIVGEIEDEHDAPRKEDITEAAPGVLALSGRAFLEDLRPYGVNIPDDEVDTIGGYLSLEAGHVPLQGEVFVLDGWRFTVDEADLKQILHVTATRLEPDDDAVAAMSV